MPGKPWELLGFMSALKAWLEHDEPPGGLLVVVAGFGAQLENDPVAAGEVDYANVRTADIPGSEHDGWIVTITYSLERKPTRRFEGEVRCQTVSCIRHPVRELQPLYPAPKHH